MIGPHTWAPISGIFKGRSVVIQTSIEPEILAPDFALRSEGMPVHVLWYRLSAIFGGERCPIGASALPGANGDPMLVKPAQTDLWQDDNTRSNRIA